MTPVIFQPLIDRNFGEIVNSDDDDEDDDDDDSDIENEESTDYEYMNDLKQPYPQQFDKIGCFRGEAVLHLKEDANPLIDASRRCSVHIKQKMKKELDEMEKQGIIRKIQHHTDWYSSITSVLKKDGSTRICIDSP
ncbi:uncharacterized protein LOC117119515 [Anneissia japonica]|uniref:uncharacterized protein LOC117119515 n=1 Tax=Anneissia japonica TaxID=1529436 RepID=UPI0014255803|nr:uncharacterized protein LOC117119515 [Anneissia japonica]